MKIGLTYDLRSEYRAQGFSEEDIAEFDQEDTIIGLETAIQGHGHETQRIGSARSLIKALGEGRRWDLVFNIAEGMWGSGREALVPALLDAYQIPYVFSDPLVLCLSLDKAACKRVVRDLGLNTPDFVVIREQADIAAVDLPFPLFAKPLAEGTGKGVTAASRITTREDLETVCLGLLARYAQPVLVETFLPGREFTCGVVGNGAKAHSVGVMEVILNPEADAQVYSYNNKENCEELVHYVLRTDADAEAAQDLSLAVWRGLGCRDAGRVDVRLDAAGQASFIEVNPLAGLHYAHSDLPILSRLNGIPFHSLIGMILDAALERLDRL